MPSSASWLLGFGCLFTLISLAFVAISFATDNWIVVTVDRSKILSTDSNYFTSPFYFTRNRGLFRTCYEGNETKFLDGRTDVIDGNCLPETGYEISRNPATIGYGSDYDVRIHLMRSHFGFFVLSMLFLVIGALVGVVGCWRLRVVVLQIGGLLVFIGAFFAASGMAFFHGYDYLEREKINQPGDFRFYIDTNFNALKNNSYWSYGYSYMLGWVGVGCAAIGAILFLIASFIVSSSIEKERRSQRKEEKKYRPSPYEMNGYGGSSYPYGYGNAGYMEDPYSTYNTGYTPSYYPTATPAITY